MTPAEREMLLKLWEDVPECRPKDLHWVTDFEGSQWQTNDSLGGCGPQKEGEVPDHHAAAIARDAMVIWLAQRFCGLFKTNEPNGWAVWEEQDFGIRENVSEAETALLALIAACRRLTGRESA